MVQKYDESQRKIIDTREGFLVADAGPGTGKTHTVVGRCIAILTDNLKNLDFRAAMLTFTRNAAGEMEERLLGECSKMLDEGTIRNEEYKPLTTSVRQMFIGTFDSFCLSILKNAPWEVSSFFRFKESLTTSAKITENETINRVFFNRFVNEWLEEYGLDPRYGEYPAIVSENPGDLYDLVNHLMSLGIMPMEHGWFGGTPRRRADKVGPANEPLELRGNPSAVLENLKTWVTRDWSTKKEKEKIDEMKKCYDSSRTDGLDIFNIDEAHMEAAAYDDRDALLATVHDIYYRYMERCVSSDHLTFGLTACFAFVALYNSEELRKKVAVDHLIVDEFQDTNTLQMMISMMVLDEPNLCVVGDWRQGIYGFRYVSVENITKFHERLVSIERFLNDDAPEGHLRVPYEIPDAKHVAHLPLSSSYRSSQLVVDASYRALALPGKDGDDIDETWARNVFDDRIRSVNDELLKDKTWINKILCSDREQEAVEVARRVIDFVKKRTPVFDKNVDGKIRQASFKDVTVLCRRTKDCRLVYRELRRLNVPAFLQGDMEIMNTPEGKLLLAWMKYVENQSDAHGIVPILAFLGYSANEISQITTYKSPVPEAIVAQCRLLTRKKRRITDFVSSVFDFHGLSDDITQAIGEVLSSAHDGSLMTISEMITMIETDIENRTSYNVDGHPDSDAVFVQTMHKSKGLEYAYVIIPFMDSGVFPKSNTTSGTFTFTANTGIRCDRTIVEMANGASELDGSWKTRIALKSEPKDYDEERRLLFVAVSRAKQYVSLIACDNRNKHSSAFFKNFDCAEEEPGTEEPEYTPDTEVYAPERPEVSYSRNQRPLSLSVHDIMTNGGVEKTHREKGKSHGMAYGTRVHKIAEMMARGTSPSDDDRAEVPEIDIITRVLADQGVGAPYPEVRCTLKLNVDGKDVVLNGEIDLLVIDRDEVRIYDWKTDVDESYVEDYRTQLSVYANCAMKEYEDKKVSASIVWLSSDNPRCDPVDILSETELEDVTRKVLESKQ